MRVQLQPAWIIHSRAYRETSVLVEAFSRDFGRVGLLARGARRPKSRMRGELQPFRALLLSWSGRGELPVVTGVDAPIQGLNLTGDALAAAFYVNELILKLLPRNDANEQLFSHYVEAIESLRQQAVTSSLRIFEKRLLDALGWGLILEHDAQGRALEPDQTYVYDLELGPVAGTEGRLCLRGSSLLALFAERLVDQRQLKETQRLTRAALNHHLGGSEIRSRELLRSQVISERAGRPDKQVR